MLFQKFYHNFLQHNSIYLLKLIIKLKNNNLKKYGFEMYDEIFDYEFDKKESLEERIDGIMKNLLKIKDEDYSNIYEKLKEKIEKNTLTAIEIIKQNKFTSQEFSLLYTQYKDEFENAIKNNKFKKFYF